MAFLSHFPPPNPNAATVCERNYELISDTSPQANVLDYSRFSVENSTTKSGHSLACLETKCKPAFIQEELTYIEHLKVKWQENGLTGLINELQDSGKLPAFLNKVSALLTTILKYVPSPNLIIGQKEEDLPSFCKNRESLPFASHKNIGKLAIATKNGLIKIIDINSTREDPIVLRDKKQHSISCLQWRPLSSMSIAAGCQGGVLVWLLDSSSNLVRPSSNMTRFFQTPAPVTSISWSKDGKMLACACANSPTFWIWNIVTQQSTAMHRPGAAILDLSWSPCGLRLLTTTLSNMFRVWESETWLSEKWGNLKGCCTNAVWSPCGTVLLFAVAEECVIYSSKFFDRKDDTAIDLGGTGVATKSADTSVECWDVDGDQIQVGGNISGMALDPTGSRLAVMFEGADSNQPYIALYCTTFQPVIQLVPCGFISGKDGETPLSMSFVNGYNRGALLAVCWSSETVSLIPLLFNNCTSPRLPTSETSQIQHRLLSNTDGADTSGEVDEISLLQR